MAKREGKTSGTSFDPAWLEVGADEARARIAEAGERAADLVEAWVAKKNAAAVLEIAMDEAAPTAARKAARRGINVLKSRGVAIPERARPAVSAARRDVVEAWFRPPDGGGTSAFTLGARSPEGRYRLVDVILKEGAGLVSIAGMQMSRTQLRETFDGIAQRFGHPPAPVPIEWARARIASARRANDASGAPVPLGFDTHRDLLGPAPAAAVPHPALRAKLPAVARGEALDRSAKLHAEPELRGWLPDPETIRHLLVAVSTGVRDAGSDRGAAEQRIRELIEKATDSFFAPAALTALAERMKDAVLSMVERGARDRAADLLATADAVSALGPDDAPHSVPFLRAFFEKAFGLATARAAAQKGA
jgi:hypothetical protein